MSRKKLFIFFSLCLILAILSYYNWDMTEKTNVDKMHERLILQAKKLALVELQVKIKEDIDRLDTELNCIDSDEDEIPF
jgi:hypothetical protein